MDLELLFSSDSDFRGKFIATISFLSIALVCYGLVGFVNQGTQLISLINTLYPVIIQCISLMVPILIIKFIRWRTIESFIGLSPPILGDAKSWLSSQAFLATPGGSGLAIRSLLLKRKFNLPISSTLSAIILERISDVLAIILLLIIANINILSHKNYLVWLTLMVALIGYISNQKKLKELFLQQILKRLLSKINPNNQSSNENLSDNLNKMFRSKIILISTLLGIIPWSIEGYSLYLIVNSIGGNEISWFTTTLAHSAAGLLGALSLLPGGLGPTEASTVGLLKLSGVPIEVGTPSAILIRLLTIWLATIIGILFLILPNRTKYRN